MVIYHAVLLVHDALGVVDSFHYLALLALCTFSEGLHAATSSEAASSVNPGVTTHAVQNLLFSPAVID